MGAAQAEDFRIDGAETTRNGGHTIDDDDTLTIGPGGSILVTTDARAVNLSGTGSVVINNGTLGVNYIGGFGVFANEGGSTLVNNGLIDVEGEYYAFGYYGADNDTVINNGTIRTSGQFAFSGIRIENNGFVTNNGLISVDGRSSNGIEGYGDDNTILNYGTIIGTGTSTTGVGSRRGDRYTTILNAGAITVTGERADGIRAGYDSMVTNSGSISASGERAQGIEASGENTLINSGAITVTGDDAKGISALSDNMVTNTGTVRVSGADTIGIYLFGDNTLLNSGKIIVDGGLGAAIDVQDDNTVTNSGYLFSAQGNAIEFRGTGNTLNLLQDSFLAGGVDFGANTATVNITTGGTQSVAWHLPSASLNGGAPNVSGTVPGFYDAATGVFTTIDPTGPVLNTDHLVLLSDLVSKSWQAQVSAPAVDGGDTQALGYAASRTNRAEEMIAATFDSLPEAEPRFWTKSVGSASRTGNNGVFTDRTVMAAGLLAGVDRQLDANLTAGVLAGYVGAKTRADAAFSNSYDNWVHTALGGGYLHWQDESAFVDLALTAGASLHSDRRLVNDNLAASGVSTATSDYGSVFVSPEVGLGLTLALADGWQMVPAARFKYVGQWSAAHAETGSTANASFSDMLSGVGQAALEIGLRQKTDERDVDLRLGYMFRTGLGNRTGDVGVSGTTLALPADTGTQHLAYADARMRVPLGDTSTLDMGAGALLGAGYAAASFSLGVSGAF